MSRPPKATPGSKSAASPPSRRPPAALYRRPRRSTERREQPFQRIAGWPSVEALFKTDPRAVERLFFDAAVARIAEPFAAILARAHKPYRQVGAEELARVAGTDMHGGIVALARIRPSRPITVDDFRALARKAVPLLMLDGVGNPQNIGAIARTAAFFGLGHLVLSDHPGQARLSDASYRIAKGGLEHVETRIVSNVAETLEAIRSSYLIVGTGLETGQPLTAIRAARSSDPRPLLLVLGNEEDGLPRSTLERCEHVLRLPGSGSVQSLNVSVTAGILIQSLMA